MTIASGRINSQSKHDLIRHVAKVKATTSAHSMATKYLFRVFIIPFESNTQTEGKYSLEIVGVTQVFSNSRVLVFINALEKVSAGIANIIRITQSTFEFIDLRNGERAACGYRVLLFNKL